MTYLGFKDTCYQIVLNTKDGRDFVSKYSSNTNKVMIIRTF